MAPIASSAVLAFLVWGLYIIYSSIWRLYLSPVARLPGPKLAALTQWYELYYDLIRSGKYVWKIGELHEQYGPIIGINPWELHVNDPDFYDELYAGGGARRDKHVLLTGAFGNPESMIGTISHNKHRQRRAPLNKFFSRANITRLEPLIQSAVDTLCSRVRDFQKEKRQVLISSGWSCFTNDVVSEYAFDIASQIKGIMIGSNETYKSVSHPTIFHEILNSSLPPEEKKLESLSQEGQTVIGAGTETTAWALSVTTFHILSNPLIRQKLLEELKPLFHSTDAKPTFNQLEQLPYLGGVISEGLRLSYGVTTHLQRVSPDTAMHCQNREIPPGTPVSMSSILLHQNPTIFPDPHACDPDRWIDNPGLKCYLVSFSKGSRQCLGMNLAYAELYLGLGYVVWRFQGMGLVGTTRDDVEVVADYFMPLPRNREIRILL
ncbi:Cytochrome P450 monooxygenase SAT11 [Lachnellula arida]|uniref:Cytochrome P450 monooxygenase SAT11 n=1 Tax=Lachnellula arida TaxID=1316785 RepID=A0A8T9BEN1_9HELO|nr:Cytochrome P450 monooxygenase SAT11 [Lachnellula arida]